MILLSLDIETTALDPSKGLVLTIGATFYDPTKSITKSFHAGITHKEFFGEEFAMNMNKELIEEIKEQVKPGRFSLAPSTEGALKTMIESLDLKSYEGKKITLVGKNLQRFDLTWLEHHAPEATAELLSLCSRRILDVGPMFAKLSDDQIPDLKTCMERAGRSGSVTHDAEQDSFDTLNCALFKLRANEN